MATEYKILWVQDDIKGPYNGVIETSDGQKVWFMREESASSEAVSSLNGPMERTYVLYELSEEDLQKITANHEASCAISGAPLKHGDPRIIRIKTETRTKDESTKEEGKEYDAQFRALVKPVFYKHDTVSIPTKNKVITIIKQSQIKNYFVPRTAVVE